MNLEILENQNVDEQAFNEMVELDQIVWPEDDPSHMTREYQESLFLPHKDGLFVAIDKDEDCVAGYFNCIFCSESAMHDYIYGGKFQDLNNIGMKKGDNILYLYTANIRPEYRGSGCMKMLGKHFASWLDELEEEGVHIKKAFVEAVSKDGARTITKGFGMDALADVDEDGIGHYISEDGLKEYREQMRRIKA